MRSQKQRHMGDNTGRAPVQPPVPRAAANGANTGTQGGQSLEPRAFWAPYGGQQRIKFDNSWVSVDGPTFCQQRLQAVMAEADRFSTDVRNLGYADTGVIVFGWVEQGDGKVAFVPPFTSGLTSDLITDSVRVLGKAIKRTLESKNEIFELKVMPS